MSEKKLNIFERIALNILLKGKKFRIEGDVIYDDKKLPVGKEMGEIEARNFLLAQQLKAMEKPKKDAEVSDEERWQKMKKSMTRIPSFDGAKLIGSDRSPLSATVAEMYLDGKTGTYWINAKSGNSFQVIGPHPWTTFVQTNEKNDNTVLHINYIRGSTGRLKFMPVQNFEPKQNPEHVLLDTESNKYDSAKILSNLEDIEKEKKAAQDLLLVTESKLDDIETNLSARVMALEKELDTISSALSNKAAKPKKEAKGEVKGGQDGPKDTVQKGDDTAV
ncbi:MAG: hypothetical protein QW478_05015 [Candidatus Micrarchaeaceae archaeon]